MITSARRPVGYSAAAADSFPEPVVPARRVDQIDILRGIALFGVLMVNLVTEFRISIFAQFTDTQTPGSGLDHVVTSYLTVLLESKAFILFSFLFGVGMAVQYERASRNGRALPLLIRRLLILLAIGLVHLTLVWNGDILTEYAVAGFIALPFLFGSQRVLIMGVVGFLGLYLAIPVANIPIPFPDTAWLGTHLIQAQSAFSHGGLAEVAGFEQAELPYILSLHLFVLPRTISLFLFGAFVWRTGLLRQLEKQMPLLAVLAGSGLLAGSFLTLVDHQAEWLAPLGRLAAVIDDVVPIVLAVGYGATILLLATMRRSAFIVRWAAPIGRMAFTNYLMQSLIFSGLFFGWGFGLYGLGAATTFALGLSVYIVQVVLSRRWLRCFRFGPVEWLWRTLMYGAWQPMRRQSAS